MRAFHLIAFFLVAATAWADARFPYAFFVKIDGVYFPLSGHIMGSYSVMTHNNMQRMPTKFALQDDFLITYDQYTPGHVGFYRGLVSFGSGIPKTYLDFDSGMKVLNKPFVSCKIMYTSIRCILYSTHDIPTEDCYDVELYFLKCDGLLPSSPRKSPSFERIESLVPSSSEKLDQMQNDEQIPHYERVKIPGEKWDAVPDEDWELIPKENLEHVPGEKWEQSSRLKSKASKAKPNSSEAKLKDIEEKLEYAPDDDWELVPSKILQQAPDDEWEFIPSRMGKPHLKGKIKEISSSKAFKSGFKNSTSSPAPNSSIPFT